jgi:hypothetical protein
MADLRDDPETDTCLRLLTSRFGAVALNALRAGVSADMLGSVLGAAVEAVEDERATRRAERHLTVVAAGGA